MPWIRRSSYNGFSTIRCQPKDGLIIVRGNVEATIGGCVQFDESGSPDLRKQCEVERLTSSNLLGVRAV
jgi:hypothetical protein